MAVTNSEQPTKQCLEFYQLKSKYFFELLDIRHSMNNFYKMPWLHRFLNGGEFIQKQEIRNLELLAKIELLNELILKEGGMKWL